MIESEQFYDLQNEQLDLCALDFGVQQIPHFVRLVELFNDQCEQLLLSPHTLHNYLNEGAQINDGYEACHPLLWRQAFWA